MAERTDADGRRTEFASSNIMGRRLEGGGRATGLGPSCLAGAEEEEEEEAQEECTYPNHVAGSPTDHLGLDHRTYNSQVRCDGAGSRYYINNVGLRTYIHLLFAVTKAT